MNEQAGLHEDPYKNQARWFSLTGSQKLAVECHKTSCSLPNIWLPRQLNQTGQCQHAPRNHKMVKILNSTTAIHDKTLSWLLTEGQSIEIWEQGQKRLWEYRGPWRQVNHTTARNKVECTLHCRDYISTVCQPTKAFKTPICLQY